MTSAKLHAQPEHICSNSSLPHDLDEGTPRGQDCQRTSLTYIDKYRTPGHWIPHYQVTPPKTIKVNFVICRNDAGQNGWAHTSEYLAAFEDLVWNVSNVYTAPSWRNYPSTCPPADPYFTTDSRIRFELNNVYFIDNSRFNEAYGNWTPNDPTTQANAPDILNWLWANHPESKEAMNHIFTSPGWDDGVGYQGYFANHDGHSYIHSINMMLTAYGYPHDDWDVNALGHSAHEYGHAVGRSYL